MLHVHLFHVQGVVYASYDLLLQQVSLACPHVAAVAVAHFSVPWVHVFCLIYWQPVVALCDCGAYAPRALASFHCVLVHCAL